MAKSSTVKSPRGKIEDPEPGALRTLGPNGEAPDSRIRNAEQAYEVCTDLNKDDMKRRKKRERIYKAYNRFPPNKYSTLAKEGQDWNSNVNFGMMAFVVDNNLASFYDMLSERTEAASIKTKKGNPKEKGEWSDHLTFAFNQALERWDDFLLNQEQDLLDMLLYGKGIEMWEDNDGFQTKHVSADEILVPDSTKINLSNFDVVAVKWTYQLYDLYEAIEDKETAESMGWNVEAVIEAMRWQRDSWRKKTNEQFTKDIKEGNVAITSHLKESVSCYILYVREFSGKISKHMVMQHYPTVDMSKGRDNGLSPKNQGFLFTRTEMFDSYKQVFAVFIDNAGSGMWHNTPSLAEKIFVQCRQYDFAMNAIMDAIKINMTLIVQGQTAEATEKLKEIVFGPYTILPADVTFAQHRFALPTQEATAALQFTMLDMNRGIGNYRIHEKGAGGEAPTATQSNLDATEAAKLTGTQLRRFNTQHSIYYREMYRRLATMTKGEDGYEIYEEFKEYLDENKVPKDAWEPDNIYSIKSNMLSGAGSPSYKLMAAQQTIQFTNIAPKDDGQMNAVRDAIAALQGRSNVDRYMPKQQQPDPTWNERIIGFENEGFESPVCNPQNLMVYPSDNHVEHIQGHLNDLARTISLVNQNMQKGTIKKEDAAAAMTKMLNQGGHINAHMQILQKDQTKKEMAKQFAQDLAGVQREADQLGQQFGEMQKKQAEDATGDLQNDPDVRKQLALAQIAITTKQQLANIQIGALSQKHQQRVEMDKDKAANQIAIERAKAVDKLETSRKNRRKTPTA